MTTPGKAKLIADESSRDLDAGLDKVEAGRRAEKQDEAQAERDPGAEHEPAGPDDAQRR
ncbi:hypothetical protein ODJ79_41335 [Actinoplanes sp. KI2]|uniref:hypothetical protein n=1 Tax=Actinoplanes sp. KI2 TaxID=2983315 RepID=UPI0021D5DE4A|nr:hypothetical protein [Actinoplanes sp. KI2]MCU7730199.1 hypothetical protein [Actinoplanes sp. KI2]